MSKKIFRSTCLVALLVFFLNLVLVMGVVYQYFERQIQKDLASEARFVAQGIEQMGMEYFDGLVSGDKRLTVVAPNGMVLYDTDAKVSELDNHRERKEIQEALQNETGTSIRKSQTLMVQTIYYATRLSDGNVLRVASTQQTGAALLIQVLQPICAIILLALLLAAFLSSRVAKSIVKPINALNLDAPEENQEYEELSPLLTKIARQKREIQRQLVQARQRQEEFRLITENMREGFLMIDAETHLLTHNSAALQLLGITGEVGGTSVLDINRTPVFLHGIENVLKGEHVDCFLEGDGRCCQLIANPVWEDAAVIGAVLVLLDVTEQQQREKLRREFTSNVSHELKTPLTSISGFAELMKNGGVPEAEVVDFSQSIYEEAQRLIALVQDIIQLSQLDENVGLYETETVDLYGVAQETVNRFREKAEKQTVTLSLQGEPGKVQGVRQILQEMADNLCDNAIKYNQSGGSVTILVRPQKDAVELVVTDTGIGIPLAQQERVFERFYRGDQSHSRTISGTGLGLSIVKHGAICHNAALHLESKEGQGTAITIRFPVLGT